MPKLPSLLEVGKQLVETGEAHYLGHKITPVPFNTGYEVNGPDAGEGVVFVGLEEALVWLRGTIQEPKETPLEVVKRKLLALRKANTQRIREYVRNGGEEHHYLDGKDAGFNEAIGIINEEIKSDRS